MRPVTADYANEHSARRATWFTRFQDGTAIPDPKFSQRAPQRRPSKLPWWHIADRQVWQINALATLNLTPDNAIRSARGWAKNHGYNVRALHHNNGRDVFLQFGQTWYDGSGRHSPS